MFVFVYGTLKKDYKHNHHYMQNAEFIANGEIKGYELQDTGFGYPCITPDVMGEKIVQGEMYLVDGDIMDELEYLEGTAIGLYERVSTIVTLENGKRFQAWVYVCGPALEADSDKFVLIPSGEWTGPVKREMIQ